MFGKVVGGLDTLSALERVDTDNKDKPIEPLKIVRATVFVDPFTEVDEALAKEREEELAKTRQTEEELKSVKKSAPVKEGVTATGAVAKAYSKGVGKFISPSARKEARKIDSVPDDLSKPKKKKQSSNFSDFSAW